MKLLNAQNALESGSLSQTPTEAPLSPVRDPGSFPPSPTRRTTPQQKEHQNVEEHRLDADRKQLLSTLRVTFFSSDEDEDGVLSFFEVSKMLLRCALEELKRGLVRRQIKEGEAAMVLIQRHVAAQIGVVTNEGGSSMADRGLRNMISALEQCLQYLTADCHALGISLVA
jgi:hypothetical protein